MAVSRLLAIPAMLALGVGCTYEAPMPLPPSGTTAVRVAPAVNATGRPLPLNADPGPGGICGRPTPTVPARLELELRRALAVRGYGADAADAADLLTVRILDWEPEVPNGASVTVSLDARLTAPDGTVRWEARRRGWVILSPWREADVVDTFGSATETIARTLTDGWCAPTS